MQYRTTVASSLITSGIVSIILYLIPFKSVLWGIGLLALGIAVLFLKKSDNVPTPSK